MIFNKKTIVILVVAVSVFAIVGVGLWAAFRPLPVWQVEAAYETAFRRLLASSGLPNSWQKIQRIDDSQEPGAELGSRYYGFRISTQRMEERPHQDAGGIRVLYPYLSRTGEYQGSLALAVDPWMVFRSNAGGTLSRPRAEGVGEGFLFMAGKDPGSLAGWTAQLLQEQPGGFPPWGDQWVETAQNLIRQRHFQQGALTYTWVELWPRLIDTPSSWIYAPLSSAGQLPGYRLSLLEADRFPEKANWNEFSLQAQILWAVPFDKGKTKKSPRRFKAATDWLKSAQTQSDLAAALGGWIPAHREGRPATPVARSAQLAWLSSSYIWSAELPPNIGDI